MLRKQRRALKQGLLKHIIPGIVKNCSEKNHLKIVNETPNNTICTNVHSVHCKFVLYSSVLYVSL